MIFEGMYELYNLNELGGTEKINITDVSVDEDHVCMNWQNETDDGTLTFDTTDFNKLFGELLTDGQASSLTGRTIIIDFDIFFEDEEGNECSEPNAQINYIIEYSE